MARKVATDAELAALVLRTKPERMSRSRSTSRSLSSASSSDREGPAVHSPPHSARGQDAPSRHALVIDHQGSGKVFHKPDGTVVWEPAPESVPNRNKALHPAVEVGIVLGALQFAVASLMGIGAAMNELDNAQRNKTCLTQRHFTAVIANTVSATMAGTLTGMVLGPVSALRSIAGVVIKPALVGFLLHQGFTRLKQLGGGVSGIIRKLQSGDMSRILEALRAIIAACRRNPRFAKDFNRLAGIEVLLQRLAEAMPDCPILHLLAQALAELCKDQDCREALVSAGGVPRLVGLLMINNPTIAGHALAALSTLSDHALAQEAIRESGGIARLVQLTSTAVAALPLSGIVAIDNTAVSAATATAATPALALSPAVAADRSAALLPAVKLLQALSLDPAGKAAIGEAGGVSTLLSLIARAEQRSTAQAEAIVALHNVLRGSADNQRVLAAIPAASEVLRGALAGYGPCWHPAKAELHALLNVLARLQGAQEAGGFVVVQSQVAVNAPPAAQPPQPAAAKA